MKRALIAAAIAAVVVGGWCFARGLFADDEAAVRAVLEDMRLAAEARDVNRFMSHVSNSYKDDSNNNAFVIRRMVGMVLGPLGSLKVRMENVQVMVTGDTAYATMTITTEAVKRGQLVSPFGSTDAPERPRVTFKKDGGDWEIVKVDDVQGNY